MQFAWPNATKNLRLNELKIKNQKIKTTNICAYQILFFCVFLRMNITEFPHSMEKKLYVIVFVILLLFSILFYLKFPHELREFLDINLSNNANLKHLKTPYNDELRKSKKVKFLNTGLERVIDIDGNITDKPIYIDVG